MKAAPIPANELKRLEDLLNYKILDTLPEIPFDDITQLASSICQTPIALVSLVDKERQWFKSKVGLNADQTPRDVSFCGHTIHQIDIFEIKDSLSDVRFADNPLVTGAPHVRFYAGAPLITPSGYSIGTLCVIDHEPRELTLSQKKSLTSLARLVINQFELRLSNTQDQVIKKKLTDLTFALNESAIVGMTDSNGKITFVNQKFIDITGYSSDELLGQDHRILNSGYHSKTFFKDLWTNVFSGKTWRGEIRNKNKAGEIYWVDTTIVPILNPAKEVVEVVSIRFDVSQRKLAEQQLMHSSKMSLLGTLAGGLAHEINNPLMIIRGKTEHIGRLIDTKSEEPIILKTHLGKIQDNVSRIANIVSGLKIFAGTNEQNEFEEIRVKDLIEQTVVLFNRHFYKNDIEFSKSDIDPELIIYGRLSGLAQILTNLLSNAFDAVENLRVKWISIEVTELKSDIEIAVTDSGGGIHHSIHEKIMEPFYTTKPVGKGVGLGLSLALSITEKHRGSLKIDSQSTNTRFLIRLPKAHASTEKQSA